MHKCKYKLIHNKDTKVIQVFFAWININVTDGNSLLVSCPFKNKCTDLIYCYTSDLLRTVYVHV